MNYEITLSPGEEKVLKMHYEQDKDKLFERWKVRDFGDYLHLLVMHGSDCIDQLPLAD